MLRAPVAASASLCDYRAAARRAVPTVHPMAAATLAQPAPDARFRSRGPLQDSSAARVLSALLGGRVANSPPRPQGAWS